MWGRQPGEEGPGSGTLRKQNTVDWVGGVDGRGARMEVGWWGSLVVIASATTAGRGASRGGEAGEGQMGNGGQGEGEDAEAEQDDSEGGVNATGVRGVGGCGRQCVRGVRGAGARW